MIKYVYEDMLTAKSKTGKLQMGSKYFEIQYDYAKLLLEIVKVLLKSKSPKVKSEIFRFLAVAIYSN